MSRTTSASQPLGKIMQPSTRHTAGDQRSKRQSRELFGRMERWVHILSVRVRGNMMGLLYWEAAKGRKINAGRAEPWNKASLKVRPNGFRCKAVSCVKVSERKDKTGYYFTTSLGHVSVLCGIFSIFVSLFFSTDVSLWTGGERNGSITTRERERRLGCLFKNPIFYRVLNHVRHNLTGKNKLLRSLFWINALKHFQD